MLPALTGVCIFYLIPFADVVRRSFVRNAGHGFCGLQNYRQVFQNAAFQLAAWNTCRFVLICLPLLLVLSLAVAMLLEKQFAGQKFFKSTYLIPLALPAAGVVLLWQVIFDYHGMLNGILQVLHLDSIDWMNSRMSFAVLVFSYLWKNLGYDVILWLAGLTSVPADIYEAARVDGASERQILWRITLPNIRPVAFTIVILSFLNTFKVFREAWLVAGSYPQESMYLLQHLFNNWFQELSVDKMAAGSVLLALVIGAVVLILQKSWNREELL